MSQPKTGRHLLFVITAILLTLTITVPVSAASKATKNKKATALYEKKAASISSKSMLESKKYVDLTGDGIKEAIFYYHPRNTGSGRKFVIYTYKKGKIKKILNDGNYGLENLIVYKKSKSFIAHGAGHGGEWYRYYKLSGGKYKKVATKRRVSVYGGSFKNGPWSYFKGADWTDTNKSEFNTIIKSIKKGKKKNIKLWYY